MFKVIKKEGKARRGVFTCAHGGEVQTPVFMNVGTQAAIKGGVSAIDLKERLGTQIELSNTYHLHLRPGARRKNFLGASSIKSSRSMSRCLPNATSRLPISGCAGWFSVGR